MGGEDKKAEIYEDDGKICKDFKLRRDMVEFLPSRLFWWLYGRMTWKVGTEERDLERDQQLVMRIQISVNAYREHWPGGKPRRWIIHINPHFYKEENWDTKILSKCSELSEL